MVRGPVRALKTSRGDSVSRSRAREFRCPVVQENVQIRLRRSGGFGRPNGYFVQWNQLDCQYVEEHKPPCPLHVEMFADEIRAADEARRDRLALAASRPATPPAGPADHARG